MYAMYKLSINIYIYFYIVRNTLYFLVALPWLISLAEMNPKLGFCVITLHIFHISMYIMSTNKNTGEKRT